MANTQYTTLSALFKAIADAIRTKLDIADTIVADQFPDKIASITTVDSGLTDATPGTATAAMILKGETAWVNGVKITGTIATYDGSATNL